MNNPDESSPGGEESRVWKTGKAKGDKTTMGIHRELKSGVMPMSAWMIW